MKVCKNHLKALSKVSSISWLTRVLKDNFFACIDNLSISLISINISFITRTDILSRRVTCAIYDFSLINEPTFTSVINRTLSKPSLRVSFKFSIQILFFSKLEEIQRANKLHQLYFPFAFLELTIGAYMDVLIP